MIRRQIIFFFSIAIFFSAGAYSQDTIINDGNPKYRVGVKIIHERSSSDGSAISFGVYSAGFQAIRRIKQTKSSFESGIYLITKAKSLYIPGYYPGYFKVIYRYITVPFNYRLDTKSIYLSSGIFADYSVSRRYDGEYLTGNAQGFKNNRKFNIGFDLNVGLEKSVSDRFNIFGELRLAITPGSSESEGLPLFDTFEMLGSSGVNYGVGIGVNYGLFKLTR